MNAVTAKTKEQQASDALRCLADGVDTKKVDDFLDQLFQLAERLGSVTCALVDDQLCLQTHNVILDTLNIERAKSSLRMVCARLAVRCSESAKRKVSAYGDVVEFEYSPAKRLIEVRFENTTVLQQISIVVKSANGIP